MFIVGSQLLPALIALGEFLSTICLSFAYDFCVSVALEPRSRSFSKFLDLCEPDRSYARIDAGLQEARGGACRKGLSG